jgi:L-amino acid N-acyltransferase YncA
MLPRIRAATEADLVAIQTIYTPAVLGGTASFELEPPDIAELTRRRAALVSEGFPYLVAEIDGAIAGYAYAGPYRPRPAYRHVVENSIYIAPDRQGQGVGRALLEALIVACEALGKRQMIAVIGDSLSANSINLHRALGFTHAGTVENVGYKHGRWLDQVIYQRALGSGAETPPSA